MGRLLRSLVRLSMNTCWWTSHTSDLLDLFEKAGLPRRQPPAFAPQESLDAQAPAGRSPEIASPLSRVEYAVRVGDPVYGEIPFIAVVPSDVTRVFWFKEGILLESPAGHMGASGNGRAWALERVQVHRGAEGVVPAPGPAGRNGSLIGKFRNDPPGPIENANFPSNLGKMRF